MTWKLASPALLVVSMTLWGCEFLTPLIDKAPDRPYSVTIKTRDRWPEGVPVRVEVDYGGPIFYYQDLVAEATPVMKGGITASKWMSHGCGGELPLDFTQPIGTPPAGTKSIDFRLKVKRTDVFVFNTKWIGESTVPIEIGGSIDDVLTPVRDPEIDQLLADAIAPSVSRTAIASPGEPCHGGWSMWWSGIPKTSPLVQNITFAVRFEILRNDTVVGSVPMWWYYTSSPASRRPIEGNESLIDRIVDDEAEWTVRMVPDPELALRNFKCNRYWVGEVRFPLKVTERRPTELLRDPTRWKFEETVLYNGAASTVK